MDQIDPVAIANRAFLNPTYNRMTRRRQEHLASLGLPIVERSVLEIGSGPGDHTGFFTDRQCFVTATDARADLLMVLKTTHPDVPTFVVDWDTLEGAEMIPPHDIVYAYGILYHLGRPAEAIAAWAARCDAFLLLETCVSPGDDLAVNLVEEEEGNPTQAASGFGCRPTRPWIMAELAKYFPHVYTTRSQPWWPEFSCDWRRPQPLPGMLYRAVFVASRDELALPTLTKTLPATQTRA